MTGNDFPNNTPSRHGHDHSGHSHAWEAVSGWLGADRYAEHSICLTNDPVLILMYVACHLSIALAYTVIGLTILTKQMVIAELTPQALRLYGSFIFLCACTHYMAVVTLFTGIYRLEIAILAATAAVSCITAYFTASELLLQHRHSRGK